MSPTFSSPVDRGGHVHSGGRGLCHIQIEGEKEKKAEACVIRFICAWRRLPAIEGVCLPSRGKRAEGFVGFDACCRAERRSALRVGCAPDRSRAPRWLFFGWGL